MKKGKKKTGLIIGACAALVVLVIAVPLLANLNTKIADYPYSPELPKPGVGVDIKNDGAAMRAYIAWNKFYNNTASALWKAPEGVAKTELKVTTRDGEEIGGYILEPAGSEDETLTTMLYCHGGAFFMPILPSSLSVASQYVTALNCRVFMPEYRLTPANPYPVPVNDCYDTLKYIAGLDTVDKDRVIIYGESAGGCLAAETLHMCRDEGLLEPIAAMLIYPVADNAQNYPSLTNYEHATWSREANLNMWKLYLDGVDMSAADYAVPMQQEDFSDYPPVYIEPSEMDTLCDQDIALAAKMREAGVDVSGETIPGAYHGFDGNLESELVKKVLEVRINWLRELVNAAEQ